MSAVDWDTFGVERLAAELRGKRSGPDAEKMIWAFEEAVRVARIDQDLLDYLLVATCCLLARVDNSSPRDILETFFRRSLTTEVARIPTGRSRTSKARPSRKSPSRRAAPPRASTPATRAGGGRS
jgi:hypothetical protein